MYTAVVAVARCSTDRPPMMDLSKSSHHYFICILAIYLLVSVASRKIQIWTFQLFWTQYLLSHECDSILMCITDVVFWFCEENLLEEGFAIRRWCFWALDSGCMHADWSACLPSKSNIVSYLPVATELPLSDNPTSIHSSTPNNNHEILNHHRRNGTWIHRGFFPLSITQPC